MPATASELYDKLINIYTAEYDKRSKAQKKRIKILNSSEILALDLYLDEDEDNLPPISLLEVKSEPEETSAEGVKLNPQKKYKNRIKIFSSKESIN